MIDHGHAIARGTADDLKRQIGGERIEVAVESPASIHPAREALATVAAGEIRIDEVDLTLTAPVREGTRVLMDVVRELDSRAVSIRDVGLRRPTLDDVFLTLTGHGATQEADPAVPTEVAS